MFTLHNGDNLPFLRSLESDMIDLIYIDPPYFSQLNYGDFDDRWKSMQHYLDFMVERLKEMHRVLKSTGSIYVHLDWHAVHYVKVEMDKIFGYDNFNNHIIYPYKGGGASHRRFSRKHDDLLFYSKSPDYFYNEVKEKRYVDKSKGYNPYTKQYHDENGTFVMVIPLDVWSDVSYIGHHSKAKKELMNYATAKNPKLMEKIIIASSREGDIVADFFCGSGSFLKVAHELGRSCIGCDSNQSAVLRLKSFTPSNTACSGRVDSSRSPELFPAEVTLSAKVTRQSTRR